MKKCEKDIDNFISYYKKEKLIRAGLVLMERNEEVQSW